MKNITVSIPDDVYRAARVHAAERGSSVSALVAEFLGTLSDREADSSRREALQRQIQGEIEHFRGGDRLSRDEIHKRAVR